MTRFCSQCGQEIVRAPGELREVLRAIVMPRKERKVANTLLAGWPRFISKADLIDRVYEDNDERLQAPEQTIQSHVSKLRSKLIGTGWSIETSRFVGYRFVHAERADLTPAARLKRNTSNPRRVSAFSAVEIAR